jgi:hypothetical protein
MSNMVSRRQLFGIQIAAVAPFQADFSNITSVPVLNREPPYTVNVFLDLD